MPGQIRAYIAQTIADTFPRTSERLADHSTQIGSPVELSREAIQSEVAANGAQSPGEFQSIIQAAGFDLYVHEWWIPGTVPPVVRNPGDLGQPFRVYVTGVTQAQKKYKHQCTAIGAGMAQATTTPWRYLAGAYDGYLYRLKQYQGPANDAERTRYFYLGGQTFPDPGTVALDSLPELDRLIYKYKPARLRCILIAGITDGIIQDSIGASDILQDSTTEAETVQDSVY